MTQASQNILLSQDAALVLALAGTATALAHSAPDEAERWLRGLRLHGRVGAALQALGVGEVPLMTGSARAIDGSLGTRRFGEAVVDEVTRRSAQLAEARSAETVGTADVLFAALDVYGRLLDRALYLRGTSREELLERLAAPAERSA